MTGFVLDEALELFRDALNQISVNDGDTVLAAAATLARETLSGSAIMQVLALSKGSEYRGRLTATYLEWARSRRRAA